MDLLESLNLDELPEQQTRAAHLEEELADNPDIQLGFNACCHCASRKVSVECKSCRRIKYCSEACRKKDASAILPTNDDYAEEQEGPSVLGHTSVICSLLRLCTADEDVENNDKNITKMPTSVREAAEYRVQSELESYPATLANILVDGPCYQDALKGDELVIHIVGASVEAELWGQEKQMGKVWDAYSEALTVLVESRKNLKTIRLCFIGPDCPSEDIQDKVVTSKDSKENGGSGGTSPSFRCFITTTKGFYKQGLLEKKGGSLPDANVIVFYNPGFTCPDYAWDKTLAGIQRGTPFLVTTNTEMEGVADCSYLMERKLIPSLPLLVAEVLGRHDVDDETEMFFGENPFAGSRVRQSGTMANDVYVRNRWMIGGRFERPSAKRLLSLSEEQDEEEEEEEEMEKLPSKKKAKTKKKKSGSGNSKKKNPALI